jgi:hypothetical protein
MWANVEMWLNVEDVGESRRCGRRRKWLDVEDVEEDRICERT